jgi:Uma2 family endonuclease
MDRFVKFDAYERAGVREYWVVDPGAHTVEVYVLGEEEYYALLGQFRAGETARSAVLEDFHLVVADLFVD